MLAGFMSIFGEGNFAVLMLNLLFEVVGLVALWVLVWKVSGSKRKAVYATFLWTLNPFHFIYAGLAMPIVAFDSLLIMSVLMIFMM
jgi:4-amino-4-deoxy-L-arabinose transferase-like glycosyltransferase